MLFQLSSDLKDGHTVALPKTVARHRGRHCQGDVIPWLGCLLAAQCQGPPVEEQRTDALMALHKTVDCANLA